MDNPIKSPASYGCSWTRYAVVDAEGRRRQLLKGHGPTLGVTCLRLLADSGEILDTEPVPPTVRRDDWTFGFWIPEPYSDGRPLCLECTREDGGTERTVWDALGAAPKPWRQPLRLDRLGAHLRRHLDRREVLPDARALAPFVPAMDAYLHQHRVIYERPARNWGDGLPLGNGRVGALVWGGGDQPLRLDLDRADLWAATPEGRSLGRFYAGSLILGLARASSGADWASPAPASAPAFLQELHLGTAEVTTRDGGFNVVARVLAERDVVEVLIEWHGDAPAEFSVRLERPAMPLLESDLLAPALVNGSWSAVRSEADKRRARETVEQAPQTTPLVSLLPAAALLVHVVPNMSCVMAAAVAGRRGVWTDTSAPRLASATTILRLNPGSRVRVLVAVVSDRLDCTPPNRPADPCGQALRRLRAARRDRQTGSAQASATPDAHRRWWQHFWQRSFVEFPDKLAENLWYLGAYHQASFSRSCQASGFFGLWHPLDYRTWTDAYVADAQIALLWWAPFATGHLELLLPSHHTFANMLPEFLEHTAQQGASIPHWFAPEWAGGHQDFAKPNVYKGSVAWTGLNFWWDFLMTGDRRFLRDTAFPLLAAIADYHAADLVPGADGFCHCLNSGSPEQDLAHDDTTYDRACIGALLDAAVQAGRLLRADAERLARWESVRQRLFPFAHDGTLLRECPAFGQPYRCHPVVLFGIHPTGTIEPGDPLWPLADRTYDVVTNLFAFHYQDRHATLPGHEGGVEPNGHATAFLMHHAARLRGWDEVRRLLYALAVRTQLKPNGLRSISDPRHDAILTNMAICEATSGQTSGLSEVLLQNYSDHVRLFAGTRQGIFRFAGLRAWGGFILAGECVDGTVTQVMAHSLKGGTLRLAHPWPGREVSLIGMGEIVPSAALGDGTPALAVTLSAGASCQLRAQDAAAAAVSPPLIETRQAPRLIPCGDWTDFDPPALYYPEDLPCAQDTTGDNLYLGLPREPAAPAPGPSLATAKLLAQSADWRARQTAARWLGSSRDAASVPLLLRLAGDPVAVVAYTAGVSLVRHGSEEALRAALRLANHTALPHLRREILKATGRRPRTETLLRLCREELGSSAALDECLKA
jgi:hypothetical protein